jgi:hypothetical protein
VLDREPVQFLRNLASFEVPARVSTPTCPPHSPRVFVSQSSTIHHRQCEAGTTTDTKASTTTDKRHARGSLIRLRRSEPCFAVLSLQRPTTSPAWLPYGAGVRGCHMVRAVCKCTIWCGPCASAPYGAGRVRGCHMVRAVCEGAIWCGPCAS